MSLSKAEILTKSKKENVHFLRLQFTDIDGVIKNVEVPSSQFEKALDGQIMFDGSSIQGFTRIEESDMLLVPDLDTFQVFPWATDYGKVGRLICDIYTPDGSPFEGCPRTALKRAVAKAKKLGYKMMAGPEAEFFLFQRNTNGDPVPQTHDTGGYFDLAPATWARRPAATSSWSSKPWASRSRLPTTRWLPASTRSTSSTRTPWKPPTPSPPSGSWSRRWH